MSPYRRNVALGATVVFALAVLAWMILKFGGNVASVFGPPTMPVEFLTRRADGVADGSAITYLGLEAGHVSRVWLDKDRQRIHIEAVINKEPALPGNVVGVIKTASLLGTGSAITLQTVGAPSEQPLKAGQKIDASFVGLGDVLPTQFGELAQELTATVRTLRESGLIADLDSQVKNAGKVIDSLHEVIGDPRIQSDLKQSITNIREVTETAKALSTKLDKFADDLQHTSAKANDTFSNATTQIARAGDNIESLSRQMGDRLTQIGKLLDQFQSISEKVDKGQGTAGQLVNDPKLYEGLVDTSRDLNATIKDFKRLVEQWEQEGVTLKLK